MTVCETPGEINLEHKGNRITAGGRLRNIAFLGLVTLLFAIAYTQSPLYTSNQNQYFLHGLAQAGVGFLEQDWLANTLDPTPVFSQIIRLSQVVFDSGWIYYLYYAILMGIYLFSLLGIATQLYDLRSSRARLWLFLALIIVIHSAGLRFALSRTLGVNWTYILEDGFADQRILGPVFQPSTFGVLLILSIFLYLRDHPYWAVISAVTAATIHPTYLLSAASLILAYLIITWIEKRDLTPLILIAGLALLSVTPILIYLVRNFALSPAETSAEARDILVNFRIPHHARIDWWFDATVLVKIVFISIALYLVRKQRRVLIILATLGIIVTGLTMIQYITGNHALALIFPWRISTFLVPISVTIILAHLVTWLFNRQPKLAMDYERYVIAGSLLVISAGVLVGGIRLNLDFERKLTQNEDAMMDFVDTSKSSGDIYLTPVKMQDFRLETGAPVYIEFKSIPYRDRDVLEWYRRVKLADSFYNEGDCQTLGEIIQSSAITHVVIENNHLEPCPQLQSVYEDAEFRVYEIK